MVRYSLLDLCPIPEGSSPEETLKNSLELAQLAERLGYYRYWLAEHHNMPGIASAATAVVIGHIAAGTKTLRIGAGGVMLPNHSPLVIAEQFGTLAALFPGRIDLGLGRAPGTDMATSMALRRNLNSSPDQFPADVEEILRYLGDQQPGQKVRAFPGTGSHVPVWILGSSLFGAQLAAQLGLPYAFASHFAPGDLQAATELYRNRFQPSAYLDKPCLMLGFNVLAAETDEEAEYQASSMQQGFLNAFRGMPGQFPPPVKNFMEQLDPIGRNTLQSVLACSAIGGPETVSSKIKTFIDRYKPDELMITGNMFNHTDRLRSFEIAAQVMKQLNG